MTFFQNDISESSHYNTSILKKCPAFVMGGPLHNIRNKFILRLSTI